MFEIELGLNTARVLANSIIAVPNKSKKADKKLTRRKKGKKRKGFSKKVKERTLKKQDYQCLMCDKPISMKSCHFHHKDENRSNNKSKNCVAVCPDCHDKITRRGIVFK